MLKGTRVSRFLKNKGKSFVTQIRSIINLLPQKPKMNGRSIVAALIEFFTSCVVGQFQIRASVNTGSKFQTDPLAHTSIA